MLAVLFMDGKENSCCEIFTDVDGGKVVTENVADDDAVAENVSQKKSKKNDCKGGYSAL